MNEINNNLKNTVLIGFQEQYISSEILKKMESGGYYTTSQITAMLGCAQATTKKKLVELMQQGKVIREKSGTSYVWKKEEKVK